MVVTEAVRGRSYVENVIKNVAGMWYVWRLPPSLPFKGLYFLLFSLSRSIFIYFLGSENEKEYVGVSVGEKLSRFSVFFKLVLTSSSFSTLRSGAPVLGEHRVPWRAVVRWPQVL